MSLDEQASQEVQVTHPPPSTNEDGGLSEAQLDNQSNKPLNLAFGELIVKAQQAGLNSSSRRMWLAGHSLLTFDPE